MLNIGNVKAVTDNKFRTVLPAQFRNGFDEDNNMVLVPRDSGYISIYTVKMFGEMYEKLVAESHTTDEITAAKKFIANSAPVHFDSSGRFTIPASVAACAKMTAGNIVYVGTGRSVEIYTETGFEFSAYGSNQVNESKLPFNPW